ncbi:hypothetical protein EKI50_08760 [Corynebacterium sanguinis]|nr:hypothetical protein EKI50_08760 [Corynebacterium sanguinis]
MAHPLGGPPHRRQPEPRPPNPTTPRDLPYSNGTLPHEYSLESIRLMGEQVIPRVRELLEEG